MPDGNWTPIILPADALAEPGWRAASGIVEAILGRGRTLANTRNPSPNFETALLYLFWGLSRSEAVWIERAVDEVNFAIDNVRLWTKFLGLHGGLCGLGWVTQYLSKVLASERKVDVDLGWCEDPNIEIDEFMLKELDCRQWNESYDAMGGLVGYGVYFLERLPRVGAFQALSLIVNHLEACAEHSGTAIGWRSGTQVLSPSMRSQCPDGYYDLGAAHGIAGVIYLFSELVAAGIEQERSRSLLEGAFEWLLLHQRPPGSVSNFSSWIAPGYSFDTRPAWCYGDLGIMAILIRAARRVGRSQWMQFAHDLLDHCLAWPVEGSGVEEAGLCHGACGVAHIFNRLYHSEDDPRCKDASLKWLELALGMWRPGTGVGGFVALTRPSTSENLGTDPDYEFLHGSIGVGLALLAALTPVEPQWDRLLLLSGCN